MKIQVQQQIMVWQRFYIEVESIEEAKELAEKARKIEESAIKIAKENERLEKAMQAFKSGEMISMDDFSSLLALKKIEAHPRTLGTLYKRISSIGHTTARFYKGKRAPQLDGVFDLAAKLFAA